MQRERWIIVGGGAMGAYIGLQGTAQGHSVTLLEERPDMGGLTRADTFDVNGTAVTVDSFYHVILESDERLRTLLSDLGLEGTVRWTSAPAEIVSAGLGYPASSIGQMATLPVLKLSDRARIGASIAVSLALPMKLANRITAVRWLGAIAGQSALKAFWWPMLRAKLGTQADQVASSFMVSTFRRLIQARLKGAGDRFGVLPGGYKPVFDAMAHRFIERGGEIHTGQAVTSVESQESADGGPEVTVTLADGSALTADRVFVTAPGPAAAKIVPQLTTVEQRQLTNAPYLGVVCATLLLDQAPNDSYITYLVDDVGLTGVIGMHALLPPQSTGGAYLVYLPHYCAVDDSWFDDSDEVLTDRFLTALGGCFPHKTFTVLASKINRARYVVPLPLPNATPPLPFTTSIPGVHVVSAAQNTTGTLNVEATLTMAESALRSVPDRQGGPN